MRAAVLYFLLSTAWALTYQEAQDKGVGPAGGDVPIDVSFCELMKSPKEFDRKLVRVKAVYRYGYEWSDLCSLRCKAPGVWFTGKRVSCKGEDISGKFRGANHFVGRTLGVVAVGEFHAGGPYGHLGGYDYEFEVKCFERAEMLLDNNSNLPGRLSEEQRRKVEAFESEK